MNKGSSTIIIISIVVALIFLIAASVGGYFVYKYYFAEEEEKEEKEKASPEKLNRDAEGFVDCGRMTSSLEDFDDPFFGIDFDKDDAFVCMGKNLSSNCSKAKSVMDIGGIDLTYKSIGTSSFNCDIRFEVENPDKGLVWAECPLSSLMSFAREYAASTKEFQQILDKMEEGDGDRGASIFALMAITLEFDINTLEQLGGTRSE